jgi:hypothetical protein
MERDPTDANTAANCAQLLLAIGRDIEGFRILEKAFTLVDHTAPPPLLLELWFYSYAHRSTDEERREALHQVRALVDSGVRSPGWDLARTVARARTDGHPESTWLAKLADVITDREHAAVLAEWPAWNEWSA